jgi:hypothetical protein
MATYNLSAMADRVKYYSAIGMDNTQAREKAMQEFNLTADTMPQEVSAELDRLISDPSTDSVFARNDRDNILDRSTATQNHTYGLNTDQTSQDTAGKVQGVSTQSFTE